MFVCRHIKTKIDVYLPRFIYIDYLCRRREYIDALILKVM